jgi:hypothetical protein
VASRYRSCFEEKNKNQFIAFRYLNHKKPMYRRAKKSKIQNDFPPASNFVFIIDL